MSPTALFDEKKAAQAAAFFLFQSQQKEMNVLKLMKLLYLAERRSYELYCEPIIGDRIVSMPHGPVLSVTYNHINGEMPSVEGGWDDWIGDRTGHFVVIREEKKQLDTDNLLELSDADIEILGSIWNTFGHMDPFVIRDYTHTLPEWKDPNGSMIPMTFGDLFQALEFSEEKAACCIAQLKARSDVEISFREAC